MEALVILLVLSVIAVIIAAVFSLGNSRRSNLEAAGRSFQGVVVSHWLAGTGLNMTVDGVDAQVSYFAGSKHSSPYTRIRFRAPVGGRLRVVPEGLWESLKRVFGSEDLVIGVPSFDEAYVIQGHPNAWVGRVLSPEARRRIHRVAALGVRFLSGPSLTLEAGPNGVLVSVPRNLVDHLTSLETFIAESVELFRALRTLKDDGIQFLSSVELVAKGNCPVCEHPLDDSPRRCGACATPHHAECWTYFGGCSTYACKENP